MRVKLKPLREQIAVVFGASSGIGRLTALNLAKQGTKVCVAARSEKALQTLVETIENLGGEALAVVADATDFAQVKNVADAAASKFGRIDTWIHAAATFLFAPIQQIEPTEFRHVIEVNLLGQVYGALAALPHLEKQGGALIHVTSVQAWRTVPFQSAYGASKHGVKGFLQALRVELAHNKIPVCVTEIQPAAINTPIYEKGRNKMPFRPRPVPPIYQPNIVADAILYAAEHPTRDLIAGGAGLGVMFFERLSPRLTDFITELIGFVGQKSNSLKPAGMPDAFFEPIEQYNTIEGRFQNESLSFDPFTSLATNKTAQNVLWLGAGLALGGLFALKMRSKDTNER